MREIYANAVDINGNPGDYDKLVKESPVDEFGIIRIPYNDYTISRVKYEEILKKYREGPLKRATNLELNTFSLHINLGPSPRTISYPKSE